MIFLLGSISAFSAVAATLLPSFSFFSSSRTSFHAEWVVCHCHMVRVTSHRKHDSAMTLSVHKLCKIHHIRFFSLSSPSLLALFLPSYFFSFPTFFFVICDFFHSDSILYWLLAPRVAMYVCVLTTCRPCCCWNHFVASCCLNSFLAFQPSPSRRVSCHNPQCVRFPLFIIS